MNQDLQKTLSVYLDTLLSTLKEGAAFASDQIPLVIQEKLHYDLFQSIVITGLGLLLMILTIIGSKKCYSFYCENIYSNEGGLFLAWVIAILGGTISIGMMVAIFDAIKIYVAPRLYILEWVQSMLVKH